MKTGKTSFLLSPNAQFCFQIFMLNTIWVYGAFKLRCTDPSIFPLRYMSTRRQFMAFPCGTIQIEGLSTAVPIPTLIPDAQATQSLHISSMQFSPQPHVSVGSSLGKSCIATIIQNIRKEEYIDFANMLQLGSDSRNVDHHQLTVKDGHCPLFPMHQKHAN